MTEHGLTRREFTGTLGGLVAAPAAPPTSAPTTTPGGPPSRPMPAPIPAPETARSEVVVPHAASIAVANKTTASAFIFAAPFGCLHRKNGT